MNAEMGKLSIEKYRNQIREAVLHFWKTRGVQSTSGTNKDQGNRGAVMGGMQMNGFIDLFVVISKDLGVPTDYIFTKGNNLPGYFRPTKDWDFIIISPSNQLIAAIEFKSQVGSFGNNFNNRTEEALGSAVDLWTAFREQGFPQTQPPWVGYMILVERKDKSTTTVRLKEPYFKVRPEFQNTSYLDRYVIFCQKLMQERHYSATSLIWTNDLTDYGSLDEDISIDSFILSFMGFIQGKLKDLTK
jgi:hypothetical protein